MIRILEDMDQCTGCAACAQICPCDAIRMAENEEGFQFPNADPERCNDCGLCRRTCPVARPLMEPHADAPAVHACIAHDPEVRRLSSSGGAFTVLAQSVLAQGGAVFGAAFDETFRVVHRSAESVTDLDRLRRSKYVQSDVARTFLEARQLLDAGRPVLYCGAPCQVAGLRAFLGRPHPGLIACDFVCSGVPSPRVWRMFLEELSARYGGKITDVSFRRKTRGWYGYHMAITFDTGATYDVKAKKEAFFIGFGKNLFNRKSCADCRFRTLRSAADLTLADYWGIWKTGKPEYRDDQGVSLVMAHTPAGQAALDAAAQAMRIEKRTYAEAESSNPRMTSSCPMSPARSAFFQDVAAGLPFGTIRRKWMDNESLVYHLRSLVKAVVPLGLIRTMRNRLGR